MKTEAAQLTLSELIRFIADIVEIGVTVLLAYVVYKLATLIDTLTAKIKA